MKSTRILTVSIGLMAIIPALIPWYADHLMSNALRDAERGHQVESLHSAEAALKYNPYSINALFVLAGAEQRMGREADARRSLLRATELQPLNYQTWEQLAIYERDRWGQKALAEEHFRKAVELNPQDEFLRAEAAM